MRGNTLHNMPLKKLEASAVDEYHHSYHQFVSEAAISVEIVTEEISQVTAFSECEDGKCNWNQTLSIPVSLAKDLELQFKFKGKSHKLIEVVEFSKLLHINGLLLQSCSGKKSPLELTFLEVRKNSATSVTFF